MSAHIENTANAHQMLQSIDCIPVRTPARTRMSRMDHLCHHPNMRRQDQPADQHTAAH